MVLICKVLKAKNSQLAKFQQMTTASAKWPQKIMKVLMLLILFHITENGHRCSEILNLQSVFPYIWCSFLSCFYESSKPQTCIPKPFSSNCLLLVVSAVYFTPYLTGLSSMMPI